MSRGVQVDRLYRLIGEDVPVTLPMELVEEGRHLRGELGDVGRKMHRKFKGPVDVPLVRAYLLFVVLPNIAAGHGRI